MIERKMAAKKRYRGSRTSAQKAARKPTGPSHYTSFSLARGQDRCRLTRGLAVQGMGVRPVAGLPASTTLQTYAKIVSVQRSASIGQSEQAPNTTPRTWPARYLNANPAQETAWVHGRLNAATGHLNAAKKRAGMRLNQRADVA